MALLVAACLGACTSSTESDPEAGPPSEPIQSIGAIAAGIRVPAPPDGTRWQGVNGVVVAVPRSWPTSSGPCPSDRVSVWMISDVTQATPCPLVRTRRSLLQIATTDIATLSTTHAVRDRPGLHGVELRRSGVRCWASGRGPCTLAFALPSLDAWFQITYAGPRPTAFVKQMMRSVTLLQPGLTTVPIVPYGESVDVALDRLREAGLEGRSPQVDFPHYVTGTAPEAGRLAWTGDTVRLTIGDG